MSKTKKIVIVLAIFAALFGASSCIGHQREDRMNKYASEHNCTWQYSWYVDKEPVCR